MRPMRAAVVAIAALALGGSGCAADEGGSGPEMLRVYVSAPLQGARAVEGRGIEDGAKLALADAGGRIGRLRIRGVYLDDSDGGGWSIARTAANARQAAQDVTAIGYVGDLESGATRVSLPITNQAEIAQVSPASTAVDLTRLPPVGDADPDRYRPSGKQTFARVVPDDDVQARAAAVWAKKLGTRTFAAVSDRSDYGKLVQEAFVSEARQLGMRPYSMKDIEAAPDLTTAAGDASFYAVSGPEKLLGLKRPRVVAKLLASIRSEIFGPDTLLDPSFLRLSVPFARRLHLTAPFLAPRLLPPEGRRFAAAYRRRFGHEPDPAAAYGYESMALLLDAIRRAGEDGDSRAAVIDELLGTANRHSILGTYSIDGNGDTTLDAVSGYRIGDGLPVFPVRLTAPR